MKNQVYIYLFLSLFGYSQNPVLNNQKNLISTSQNNVVESVNLSNEQAYFDAVYLPITKKDSLQEYIDLYDHVRLGTGDYGRFTGNPITLTSNQSIYGFPDKKTQTPTINIAAGSTNVRVERVSPSFIDFLSGSPITNCTIKSTEAYIRATNAQMEDNLFINIDKIDIDNSVSGYMINNRFYRQQVHTISPQLTLKGNNTTPSNGNLFVWTNYLTPNGDGVDLDNMGDITFIGLDSEGWNIRDEQTLGALVYARNMGRVNITDFGGGNGYCEGCEVPAFDIEADKLFFFNKVIANGAPQNSIVRGATDVFTVFSDFNRDLYEFEVGATGSNLITQITDNTTYANYSVYLDDVLQTSPITDPTTVADITNQIQGTQHTPYPKYSHEAIPNPTGVNWATDRVGEADSTTYIQNLIDNNGIAELPEGIFYISSTLNVETNEGIIGQGTGKTAIVGLTDDFPLITASRPGSGDTSIILSNLTLQGGNTGLKMDTTVRLSAFNNWSNIVFRNQAKGIHFEQIFGFDNNYLEYLMFVDCTIGIHNDFTPKPANDDPTYQDWFDNNLGYIDKTFFYRNQYINCDTALKVDAERGCNLNFWMDNYISGSNLVANLGGHNYAGFINSEFENNSGDGEDNWLMRGNGASFYSCDFSNNTSNSIFYMKFWAEGCNFLDNIPLVSDYGFDTKQYLVNCTVTGSLGGGWRNNSGTYVNSSFAQNSNISKVLANMNQGDEQVTTDNTVTAIIDAAPNPYPQLFVKH